MIESNNSSADETSTIEEVKGLYKFILTADGERIDQSSILEILRVIPDLVMKQFVQSP